MEGNAASFPPPPSWYKKPNLNPPKPPTEGEFSMFGRAFTTKETPLRIETNEFKQLFPDTILTEPHQLRNELFKLQFSILNTSIEMIRTLIDNPSDISQRLKDYEQLILNFSQLIYMLRPQQALEWLRNRLQQQIEEKNMAYDELLGDLQNMKNELVGIDNILYD